MSIQDAERLIPIEDLEKGARDFEVFWLRPQKMANKEVILRMEIKTRWGGWKLKDGLVKSLGLVVGDTINTEVSVLNAPGLMIRKTPICSHVVLVLTGFWKTISDLAQSLMQK